MLQPEQTTIDAYGSRYENPLSSIKPDITEICKNVKQRHFSHHICSLLWKIQLFLMKKRCVLCMLTCKRSIVIFQCINKYFSDSVLISDVINSDRYNQHKVKSFGSLVISKNVQESWDIRTTILVTWTILDREGRWPGASDSPPPCTLSELFHTGHELHCEVASLARLGLLNPQPQWWSTCTDAEVHGGEGSSQLFAAAQAGCQRE